MSTPTYPVSTIARLFNLTERRVQQLAMRGVIPKAERGKYDLVACVRGYIGFLQERAFGKEESSLEAHQERARLLKAQADKTELEVKTLKGELLPATDVEKEWASLMVAFRLRMLSLPTRGAHLAMANTDFHAVEEELRNLVHDALNELSLYDPDTFTTFEDQSCETSSSTPLIDSEPVGSALQTLESRSQC